MLLGHVYNNLLLRENSKSVGDGRVAITMILPRIPVTWGIMQLQCILYISGILGVHSRHQKRKKRRTRKRKFDGRVQRLQEILSSQTTLRAIRDL